MSRMLSASAQSIARPCRTLPTISARLPETRRNASGGVHYNQPTGYLFGEKVRPDTYFTSTRV
jgi:hypothetical protein